MQEYHDDSAIQSNGEDLFGRKDYALKLATILSSLGNKSSFVVGLYSKWGYGKTSTINLVKRQLLKREDVEVIDLEPWNYATSKELAANLLYELSEKLGLKIAPTEKAGWFFRKAQNKASKVVSEAASSTSLKTSENMTLSIGKVTSTVLMLTKMLSSPREYAIQQKRIEDVIKSSGKQLIVFIDDVDRLDPDKILGVFKLIKSVASIKGVTYVVSFDEKIVSEAVSEKLPKQMGGKEYVDKIVQIPITLPLIERSDLDQYMNQKIEAILQQNGVSINEDEQRDLQELYAKVKHRFDTPRSINRFANALLFAVPLLKDEVSTSDLILIELLRIAYPNLYEAVRNNRELLTKERVYDSLESSTQDRESREEFDKAFQSNAEWMNILRTIFPNVGKYYFGSSLYNEDGKLNRKRKRLKSYEYFYRYFTYSIGSGDTPDSYFIEQLQNENLSEAELVKLLSNDTWRGLQKIEDNSEAIADVQKFSQLLVLATEKLPRQEQGFFATSLVQKSLFVVNNLLKNHSDVKALDIYLSIMHSCKSTETLSYLMRHVNVNMNSDDTSDRPLTDEEFNKFKEESVKTIKKLIDNNKMPVDDFETVSAELYQFMCLFEGSTATVNAYISSRIKTGVQAVDFISQFLGKWSNLGGAGNRYRSDLLDSSSATYNYWFRNKLNAEHLYDRLVNSKYFKQYKNIDKANVQEFNRHSDENKIALAGNEKSQEFREVIAQQFIYLYESGLKEKQP